jgi:hypothetical protein
MDPRIGMIDLPALVVDLLPQIAHSADERHEDNGYLQIRA